MRQALSSFFIVTTSFILMTCGSGGGGGSSGSATGPGGNVASTTSSSPVVANIADELAGRDYATVNTNSSYWNSTVGQQGSFLKNAVDSHMGSLRSPFSYIKEKFIFRKNSQGVHTFAVLYNGGTDVDPDPTMEDMQEFLFFVAFGTYQVMSAGGGSLTLELNYKNQDNEGDYRDTIVHMPNLILNRGSTNIIMSFETTFSSGQRFTYEEQVSTYSSSFIFDNTQWMNLSEEDLRIKALKDPYMNLQLDIGLNSPMFSTYQGYERSVLGTQDGVQYILNHKFYANGSGETDILYEDRNGIRAAFISVPHTWNLEMNKQLKLKLSLTYIADQAHPLYDTGFQCETVELTPLSGGAVSYDSFLTPDNINGWPFFSGIKCKDENGVVREYVVL